MAPGGFGAEVDDDDPIPAFGAGISDVCDALAWSRDAGAKIETDVVEILFVRSGISIE